MNQTDEPPIDPRPATARAVAIVPAAGRSRRMGRPKPLLPFGDRTVLERVAAALTAGGAGRVVVVVAPQGLGTEAGQIAELVRRLGLEVAVNPDPDRGMLSSVLAGLAAAGGAGVDSDASLLVCPADLPALSPTTVAAVLAALHPPATLLAVAVVGDRRGHPLAIAPQLVAEIAALDLEVGLRQLLDRHCDRLREVPVDDLGAIHDIDTPEEYRRLLGTLRATLGKGPDAPKSR